MYSLVSKTSPFLLQNHPSLDEASNIIPSERNMQKTMCPVNSLIDNTEIKTGAIQEDGKAKKKKAVTSVR